MHDVYYHICLRAVLACSAQSLVLQRRPLTTNAPALPKRAQFGGQTINTTTAHQWGISRVPSPRELVRALDAHVIGQEHAKKVGRAGTGWGVGQWVELSGAGHDTVAGCRSGPGTSDQGVGAGAAVSPLHHKGQVQMQVQGHYAAKWRAVHGTTHHAGSGGGHAQPLQAHHEHSPQPP